MCSLRNEQHSWHHLIDDIYKCAFLTQRKVLFWCFFSENLNEAKHFIDIGII